MKVFCFITAALGSWLIYHPEPNIIDQIAVMIAGVGLLLLSIRVFDTIVKKEEKR